jgi:hypothetical protein
MPTRLLFKTACLLLGVGCTARAPTSLAGLEEPITAEMFARFHAFDSLTREKWKDPQWNHFNVDPRWELSDPNFNNELSKALRENPDRFPLSGWKCGIVGIRQAEERGSQDLMCSLGTAQTWDYAIRLSLPPGGGGDLKLGAVVSADPFRGGAWLERDGRWLLFE